MEVTDLLKIDKFILKARETYRSHKNPVRILMAAIDVLLITYFLGFIPFSPIADWIMAHHGLWTWLYGLVNPFTIGCYMFGAVLLIHFLLFDSVVVKLLRGVFYAMIVFVSLIAIMGMTSAVELCIYLPHLLVVILCILVTVRKWKIRQGGAL